MNSGKIKIEVDGYTWYWQEFDRPDGNLECVRLFDANGDVVCEFDDYKEMLHFLRGATV